MTRKRKNMIRRKKNCREIKNTNKEVARIWIGMNNQRGNENNWTKSKRMFKIKRKE